MLHLQCTVGIAFHHRPKRACVCKRFFHKDGITIMQQEKRRRGPEASQQEPVEQSEMVLGRQIDVPANRFLVNP